VAEQEEYAGEAEGRGREFSGDRPLPKWIVWKRTKSGRYITIAKGNTRKEIIDKTIADSETYQGL
jgi:hypothetical protein